MKTRNQIDVYVGGALLFSKATVTFQHGTLVVRKNGHDTLTFTEVTEQPTGSTKKLSFMGKNEEGTEVSISGISRGGCGCGGR